MNCLVCHVDRIPANLLDGACPEHAYQAAMEALTHPTVHVPPVRSASARVVPLAGERKVRRVSRVRREIESNVGGELL